MRSSILLNFGITTIVSIVTLMVIGENFYRLEFLPVNSSVVNASPQPYLVAQVIQGSSGGPVNSVNCGFIANHPNYTISLSQRVDYMRITVQAVGGQPTLLVVGPQANDSFCVLGDRGSGLQPEISGVWEPGTYNIFIGDRTGDRHKFTLNISRSK